MQLAESKTCGQSIRLVLEGSFLARATVPSVSLAVLTLNYRVDVVAVSGLRWRLSSFSTFFRCLETRARVFPSAQRAVKDGAGCETMA
jgi:hypothetical protein